MNGRNPTSGGEYKKRTSDRCEPITERRLDAARASRALAAHGKEEVILANIVSSGVVIVLLAGAGWLFAAPAKAGRRRSGNGAIVQATGYALLFLAVSLLIFEIWLYYDGIAHSRDH
ncbi:hypothetical protein ACFFNY_25850 [Paenibacillus hodogayensis]|uniref:DUF4190 domain-containing protein n=1 Tax=Paenibacillus hodogayensis TaxID=279208 RepID=A0ABV5W363_9BACL